MSNTFVSEISRARKRCKDMGRYHAWRVDFNNSPLAAVMNNHIVCIDYELKTVHPDYTDILLWILKIARAINLYCDTTRVSSNPSAEYFLELFLWYCDRVCRVDKIVHA